ncbi:ATP-binding protein, partial [Candidatus Bathyarchaeota archaeon]|nr:ATP-binding protein [Candidatus Bathyarchaeota archaeon]
MPISVFGKDFSQIEFVDIQKLKDDGRAENQTLEYKETIPTRIDLQKQVLGFANSIGGCLLIGIREKRPEGIPDAIVGIDKER